MNSNAEKNKKNNDFNQIINNPKQRSTTQTYKDRNIDLFSHLREHEFMLFDKKRSELTFTTDHFSNLFCLSLIK